MLAPDKDRALAEADAAIGRFCELLRAVREPDALAVGHWTARDVAVHVAGWFDIYTRMVAGEPSPAATFDAVADVSEQIVAASAELDPAALADTVGTAAATYLAAARDRAGDPQVTWHAGLQLPLSSLLAVTIGEAMVHGYDIARATGARWRLPVPWAHTVFRGLLPVVPSYLDVDRTAAVRARFDVRLRGDPGARAIFTVDAGTLHVGPSPSSERVDCYLSADAATFLLVLYGRLGPAVPATTGRIMAWGRKPWLGFALPGFFRRP